MLWLFLSTMTVRYGPQIRATTPYPGLVYVVEPGHRAYFALKDPFGTIHTLREKSSLSRARMYLIDENILLLLNTEAITDLQRRVFESGSRSLERLLHACVRRTRLQIKTATLDMTKVA